MLGGDGDAGGEGGDAGAGGGDKAGGGDEAGGGEVGGGDGGASMRPKCAFTFFWFPTATVMVITHGIWWKNWEFAAHVD